MVKRITIIILILLSSFLSSCGNSSDWNNSISIKFWNYIFSIPNDYHLSVVDNKYNDYNLLYSYRKNKSVESFASSLIIASYLKSFPKDKNEFFSIMLDKLKKWITWLSITDKWHFSKTDSDIYYTIYKVNENLFEWDNRNIYYWIQVYLLDQKNKKVYLISYISLEEDEVNNIFDNIQNLEVNK